MRVRSSTLRAKALTTGCVLAAGLFGVSSSALAAKPIRIGVMTPKSLHNGPSYINGARLAADQINAHGGVNGRPIKLYIYDTKESASSSVHAFQRAVQRDHVVAVTGLLISGVALTLEPWAARLKTPLLISGAANPKITTSVHDHYDRYKYVFSEFMNSNQMARGTCAFAHDILVGDLHYKTAVLFSEDAAWNKSLVAEYKKCLPKAGLKIVDKVRFSVDTSDFTPIYNRIKRDKADVIITAISHTGTTPVVQWRQQQVPALLAGPNSQGSSSDFWSATNGAAKDVIVGGTLSANGAALTPKTPAFYKQYKKRFNSEPAFSAYTTYDAIYNLKNAIERTGSTEGDAIVKGLEKTDRVGVSGPIKFQGRSDPHTHGLVFVQNKTGGVYFQWQHKKQIVIWPKGIAQGSVQQPSFVKKH